MKIAMSTPYYPPHIGGVEIHAKNLAEGLKSRGYEVVVVSSVGSDIVVPCINVPYSPIPLVFPNIKADIYHSHVPSPFFAKNFAKLSERYKRPHVVTYHNDVVIPARVNGCAVPALIARQIEKTNASIVTPILERADVILATTHSYAKTSQILTNYLEKVEVIPNAVNPDEFIPGVDAGNRRPIILYVGRLVEYKGVSLLIEAVADLQKEIDAKLVIVGDGEDRPKFEKLAEKLSVSATFTGKIPKKDVIEWMRRARILVLPSFSRLEAFGIVLLEAMACSTPVIAANVPGVSEVAKEGGMVFSSRVELVEKLKLILTNDKIATKLGKKGRRAVEKKYNWKIILNKVEKIYGELA
ncbi:MAG: glycosyltransferase family 1 protein [Archaeoglobales archaeon]|nr:MAG: glycosyltransferase family 1 protein [Archaeoglobales archaeon]